MKRYIFLLFLICFFRTLLPMDDFIADEFAQESAPKIIKRMGQDICTKVLAQWSHYEKRLLVTMLQEDKWPAPQRGHAAPFARNKEVYQDRFSVMIDSKKVTVPMDDFKILAELYQVPVFASYNLEILKFDDLRQHFATEDEIWEQLNRQLSRGSK